MMLASTKHGVQHTGRLQKWYLVFHSWLPNSIAILNLISRCLNFVSFFTQSGGIYSDFKRIKVNTAPNTLVDTEIHHQN